MYYILISDEVDIKTDTMITFANMLTLLSAIIFVVGGRQK